MNLKSFKIDLFWTMLFTLFMAVILWWALAGCGSLRRTAWVGGGSGAGAAVGSLAGPGGAIGGAVLGGAVTSAVVESDASSDHVERLESKLAGAPYRPPPPPEPPGLLGIAWWWWAIGAYFLWLRRSHIISAINGREPRIDAVLRAVGVRTHRTPTK